MSQHTVESCPETIVDLSAKKLIRVLLVDDEVGLLKLSKQCLEMQRSFQVDTASSVDEAMEKMKKQTFDVLVSDYQMPGKDGLQFLEDLRQKGDDTPFIIFTGRGKEEVAIKALNLGATQYLDKTGDPETVYYELAHVIQQAAKRSRDTIKLEEAEQRLFDEHSRLLNVFSASPSAIIVIDLNGKITECNEQAQKLFGYLSKGEFIGKNGFSLIADRDRKRAMENVDRTLKQGILKHIRYSILNREGNEWLALVSASVVHEPSGNPSGFVIVAEDITETQRIADELQRFSIAIKKSIDGVVISDLEGKIVELNDAALRLYGADDRTDLIGKNSVDLLPEEKEKLAENMKEVMANGYAKNKEINVTRKNGTRIPVEITTAMIKDGEGNPTGFLGIVRDITERKKAEEAVRTSEERYRSYIEVTGQLGWTTNANGEVEEDIPAWRKYTGQSYEEAKGWGWTKALHPDDLEHTAQAWEKAVAEKSIYEVEYRIRRHDGVYRYFMARSVPVLEKDGKIREWVGTCIDITERKKTEEALKDSEEKFRNLAEKSPNMIFINQKGRIVYANRKAEDSMGYTREEFCSPDFNFLDLIAEESKESVKSAFSKHTTGDDVAQYEYKLITKEERKIDAIINSKLIKYDGEPAILGVVTDITDRKKAERMTLASQQSFKALFMGNPEAAAHLAPDFHILDVNPRFEELFGYSLAEAKGRRINDVIVPETKMEEAETLDKNAVEGCVYHITVRKRKDGYLVPVALSAATIMVEGKLAGCIAMYKDISELKNAEKKLETMNEKLRVVGGLTRHDVRNKLSVITGNVYLNTKKLLDHPDVLESFKDMESACEQIVRIFEFARDYERLGVEELALVDVKTMADKAVSFFSDLKGVRIVNECHGLTVLADSLWERLFYNLIDNSLKHGNKLTQIRIRYEKSENQLRLIFEDDGVGIPHDAKSKLFNEGFTTGKGSGYGLYLIKRMTEVYGWTIEENGEPGKGARFVMTIPRMNTDGKENYKIAQ